MDVELARQNMINQQIRPWEVLDMHVLELITRVPRESFVPAEYRTLAFADTCIPLGHGQTMMSPKLEARILQAVNVQPTDKILEIGTGSGYMTALLAQSGRHVFSVDIIPEFTESARKKLDELSMSNTTLETGDAANGWDQDAPYDVIVITGSTPVLSENFQHTLSIGGRMFAIIGESPVMEAVLITRVGEGEWTYESLFETEITPLINAPEPQRFAL